MKRLRIVAFAIVVSFVIGAIQLPQASIGLAQTPVRPALNVFPPIGPPGTEVQFRGVGFTPNGQVSVLLVRGLGLVVADVQANAGGIISGSFRAPSPPGAAEVTFGDVEVFAIDKATGRETTSDIFTLTTGPVLDFDLPNGHFYKQANGQGGAGMTGFAIVNEVAFGRARMNFWDEFRQRGGVDRFGYPVTRPHVFPDFPIQAMQKQVFQQQYDRGLFFLNIFDIMSESGLDDELLAFRAIPPIASTAPDTGLPWNQIVGRHLAFLDVDSEIRRLYFSVPDPIQTWGLPMSDRNFGNVIVVRAQRAAFQHWLENVGPNPAGSVTIVNGGDLAKELNVYPEWASTPLTTPSWSESIIAFEPGWGDQVSSPFRIVGDARLFEAAGLWELRNESGSVIAEGSFLAEEGAPAWGRFVIDVNFNVEAQQTGTLVIFSGSAETGERINEVVIPLTLMP